MKLYWRWFKNWGKASERAEILFIKNFNEWYFKSPSYEFKQATQGHEPVFNHAYFIMEWEE